MAIALMPEYAKNFHCAGGYCAYTCCQDKVVAIDKSTYRKYVACSNGQLKARLLKNIDRWKQGKYYAQIMPDPASGKCPFLGETGLCDIQASMGEQALSDDCRTYPRSFVEVEGSLEMCCSAGCPEVARFLVLAKEPLGFLEQDVPSPTVLPSFHLATDLDYDNFIHTRIMILQILQDRRYPFEERLVLLGMFIRQIIVVPPQDVLPVIEACQDLFDDGAIMQRFQLDENAKSIQFTAVKQLLQELFATAPLKQYGELLRVTAKGLGNSAKLSAEKCARGYMDTASKGQLGAYDYIFENYFVNDLFQTSFPIANVWAGDEMIGGHHALWNRYLHLSTVYLLLKFHFAGVLREKATLTEDDSLAILCLVTRSLSIRATRLTPNMIAWLHTNNADTLEQIAKIVRA